MQEITTVIQKGVTRLRTPKYLDVKEAIIWARDNGIDGRMEIQNTLFEKGDVVIYSLYFITDQNKIAGMIYPFHHLNTKFLLNEAVPSKTEEQPNKIVNIIRGNGKGNHATQLKALMRPNVISN